MRLASVAVAAAVAAASAACDPPDSVSADEALQATCLHARGAFGFVPRAGRFVAEPHEVASVLETDAELLRAAGDEATAALVERTADALLNPLGSAPDLVVYLRADASPRQRNKLEGRAAKLAGVESVRFVPSEEAYAELDETGPDAAGGGAAEVLPDSFEIVTEPAADLANLRKRLGDEPGVDDVDLRGSAETMEPLRMLADVCELPL